MVGKTEKILPPVPDFGKKEFLSVLESLWMKDASGLHSPSMAQVILVWTSCPNIAGYFAEH